MLNKIKKFLPPHQLGIPLLGLVLILAAVGEKIKPVLSNQAINSDTSINQEIGNYSANNYTWLEGSNSLEKSSMSEKGNRLRRVLAKTPSVSNETAVNSQQHQAETYTWLQGSYNVEEAPDSTKYAQAELEVSSDLVQESATKITKQAQTRSKAKYPRQDGIYLYGQSPKAGQFGQGYVLFEKHQSKVIGALYMPSSEYSCFQGTIAPSGELAMTVKGYPGEISPSQVATRDSLPGINNDQPVTYGHSLALEDYHQVNGVSASDRQILQSCKAYWQN